MSQWHQQIKNDPRWKAARLACFERDGWACVDCGSGEDLQADHDQVPLSVCLSDPELAYLAFDLDNLATRCGPCNRKKTNRMAGEGEIVRHTWINPRYPELAVFRDQPEDLRSLASSQNRAEKIREGMET